jgi:ATP-dependent Lhr-like helicase
VRAVKRGELDAIVPHDAPLDVLTQQLVAETSAAETRIAEDELFAMARARVAVPRAAARRLRRRGGHGRRGFSTRKGRRAALLHRDEVHGTVRGGAARACWRRSSGRRHPRGGRLPRRPRSGRDVHRHAQRGLRDREQRRRHLPAGQRLVADPAGDDRRACASADAKGAPPSIPFWLGEAPARSDELSHAVSDLRRWWRSARPSATRRVARRRGWLRGRGRGRRKRRSRCWPTSTTGRRALDAFPTQQTLVLERFFDESGGMQLVLHAPFGSRINKAWCLALRKKFCRQFNFELQAAATEDAILLSLGPQHSFPLADVFRYLHPENGARRARAGVPRRAGVQDALALERDDLAGVPRARGSRRVAPQLQRMLADDLMASVFPTRPRASRTSRRSAAAGSSARQPDGARLPAGGDGLRGPARRC